MSTRANNGEAVTQICLVTDMDRTCLRASAFAEQMLRAAAHELGVDTQEMQRTIDDNRKIGQTTQVQDLMTSSGASERQVNNAYQRFVDEAEPEKLMYADLPAYLNAVEESELVTAVLLTMGPTAQQEAKITALGLAGRIPFVIADPDYVTNASAKDWQIRSWLDPLSGLLKPRLSTALAGASFGHPHDGAAKAAVLIDDKYKAFGLPGTRPRAGDSPGIGGFWVSRVDESEPPLRFEEQAHIPHSIEPVPGLADVTKYIKNPDVLLAHDMVHLWSEQVGELAFTAHQNSK